MKLTERLILLFIIQLCFWACDNKPYSHLMSMADSLTNTNPDSAVIYLNKLKEQDNYEEIKEALNPSDYNMIVTPKEIDELIENMSSIVARGINMSL